MIFLFFASRTPLPYSRSSYSEAARSIGSWSVRPILFSKPETLTSGKIGIIGRVCRYQEVNTSARLQIPVKSSRNIVCDHYKVFIRPLY
jgi:hypothetical protein